MKLTLIIDTSGSAFEDDPVDEVERILREQADLLEHAGALELGTFGVRDVNGNRCGQLVIEGDE